MATKKKTVKKKVKTAAGAGERVSAVAGEPLLLVCLQDPFAPGAWSLYEDGLVRCDDGNAGHVWRVRAGFELLAPRILEGDATHAPVTMSWKGFGQAAPDANAHWSGTVRAETSSVTPLRVMVRPTAAGKIDISLDYGASRAEGTHLPMASDKRYFNVDVAFAANGSTGFTVGAGAVISSLPWSQLIAGSNAAVKGLAFEPGWRKNLKDKPEPLGDGAATATGAWAFALMTRAEYDAWCAARSAPPRIL